MKSLGAYPSDEPSTVKRPGISKDRRARRDGEPDPAGELTTSIPAPLTGRNAERLGSCHLCFELATGGMAKVYMAVHRGAQGFCKVVAVKKVLPELASDPAYEAMLADEASISARVRHPYVRDVFDMGTAADGTPYLVMEYLAGEPLSAIFRISHELDGNRHRHVRMIARAIAELCEGLDAVHGVSEHAQSLGVVHRDVTPQNLFVLYDGTVRVTDLGVVRARGRKQQHTRGGVLKGKVGYMSPEYVSGQPYDCRSDVWAIGVVLWEMLTSTRLFGQGSGGDRLHSILTSPILPPSHVSGDISPELDRIVLRALARKVEARYASAGQLALDLNTYLARSGSIPSAKELGAWMSELLPRSKAAQRALLDMAPSLVGEETSTSPPSEGPTARDRVHEPRENDERTLTTVEAISDRRESAPPTAIPLVRKKDPPERKPDFRARVFHKRPRSDAG